MQTVLGHPGIWWRSGCGKKGAGTVRGPVQFTFARSEDRIYQAEHSITRQVVTTEEKAKKQEKREFDSTMGRKSTVPYGLIACTVLYPPSMRLRQVSRKKI